MMRTDQILLVKFMKCLKIHKSLILGHQDTESQKSIAYINMDILNLPPEIVLKIIQNLSPTDLKNNMLVCQRWKVIAENSRLWSWCTIDIGSVADLQKLKMRRAENIEKICLENCPPKELNDVLKALVDQNLKIIMWFAFKNLTYVEPKLLANMVNKVEEADCFFSHKNNR